MWASPGDVAKVPPLGPARYLPVRSLIRMPARAVLDANSITHLLSFDRKDVQDLVREGQRGHKAIASNLDAIRRTIVDLAEDGRTARICELGSDRGTFTPGVPPMEPTDTESIELQRRLLPDVLSAAMRPGIEPEWLGQIVQHGLSLGLPMRGIYFRAALSAAERGVFVPTYQEALEAASRARGRSRERES